MKFISMKLHININFKERCNCILLSSNYNIFNKMQLIDINCS